jgi:hypothetical protein
LPAAHDDLTGWLFNTHAAHYQMDYAFPGWTGNGLLTSAPTPIPQDTLRVGQNTFATILASFKPVPATPLSC